LPRFAVAACLALICVAGPVPAFEPVAVLTGFATAADGDDIAFGEVRVRLRGIAAPEDRANLRQPGGPEATAGLAARISGREVTCRLDGTTAGSTRRPVGTCEAGGIDLGAWQVRSGLAHDCPRFSGGAYAADQAAARAAGADIGAIYARPGYCEPGGVRGEDICNRGGAGAGGNQPGVCPLRRAERRRLPHQPTNGGIPLPPPASPQGLGGVPTSGCHRAVQRTRMAQLRRSPRSRSSPGAPGRSGLQPTARSGWRRGGL